MNSNSDIAAIHAAEDTLNAINDWMKDHPVIEDEDMARAGKAMLDRGILARDDMTAERRSKVDPLNAQVESINVQYRGPVASVRQVLEVLDERLRAFMRAEEMKRLEAARQARILAEQKEKEAREAEAREKEQLANADAGELDVDVVQVIQQADDAFSEYKTAERAANIAERDAKVRIGGGFRRAIGLKKKEVLVLVDVIECLEDLGSIPEGVEAELLKAARAYRKVNKKLPRGIEAREE